MAIKDIFTMIKADRYTSDGREELIKAQEAITEDITYKPGDISRKTGLQKQPDGSWAPVKNAPAQTKKKDASGADVLNNEYYKDDVRTDKGAQKILSETKTEVIEKKVADLEDLKKRNGGKLGVQGEKDLQMAKAELAKRSGSAPGWRAPGSESDPNTEGSIAWYAQQAKKAPSASGSGLSERAQYSVSQTAAGMSTEALKSHVDKLKNDPATRNAVSNPDAMAKAYESELAKRGETVTKMSDLVAQKSRPESAPSGRQPTPEMLERDKMRHSPEFQARRDKLDAEHPRTETGAPMFETDREVEIYNQGKSEDYSNLPKERLPELKSKIESRIKYYENYNPYAMVGKKTGLTPEQKASVKQNITQAKENLALYKGQLESINKTMSANSAPSDLKIQGMSKEEYIPWRMKTYKENEAQASSVWNHFAEQQKNKGKEDGYDPDFHPLRDSAPRVLTGDCKIRIKKSK